MWVRAYTQVWKREPWNIREGEEPEVALYISVFTQ
jgi:hypothetical protein